MFASCVTHHGSHYDATFGYVNENFEPVHIAIGAHNSVSPGPHGQGQPETFTPGFVNRRFTVTGASASQAVTWTIRIGDEVRVAHATASFPPECLTSPIDPVANAGVVKTAAPRTVRVGGRVRFTILVRNTGSAVLRPAGTHRVHCRAATLPPGQSLTVRVSARATASGSATDRASVVGLRHSVASATVHIVQRAPPPPQVTG